MSSEIGRKIDYFVHQNVLRALEMLTKASACFEMRIKAVFEETMRFSRTLTNIAVTRVIDCSNEAPTRGNYAHASGFFLQNHSYFF